MRCEQPATGTDCREPITECFASSEVASHELDGRTSGAAVVAGYFVGEQRPDLDPEVCEGICKLTAMFDHTHPGSGFYGKEKGRISGDKIKLPEEDDTPEYSEIPGMVGAVLQEIVGQDTEVHRHGYGGLVYVNTVENGPRKKQAYDKLRYLM